MEEKDGEIKDKFRNWSDLEGLMRHKARIDEKFYDFLEQNDVTVCELVGILEQIKIEQLTSKEDNAEG